MWAHLPKMSVCYPHLTIHTSQCDIVTEGIKEEDLEYAMQQTIERLLCLVLEDEESDLVIQDESWRI